MKLLMFLDNIETCNACGGADIVRVIKFVWTLLDLVLFIVPIGLIVIIMVDFMKNVMAGKEDDMKKNLNIAIKRIIYCVVLFLVPTIVNFAISLVSEATSIQAFQCIDLVDSISDDELSQCEIDYENLGGEPNEEDGANTENSDGSNETTEVSVSFHANGGTITSKIDNSTMDIHTKYFEKSCIRFAVSTTFSNSAKIEREGYIFKSWNTKANGSGTTYDGTTKWDCSNNLNLYAQWDKVIGYGDEIPVSFDLNGGKGTKINSKTYIVGKKYEELPTPSTYEANSVTYVFDGWYTKKEKGDKITNSSSVDATITTLYAHWKEQYKVTFYANGGTITSKIDGSTMDKHIKYFDTKCSAFAVSTTFSNSAKIERTGYTFDGWNTKADGSGTTYRSTSNWNCSSNLDLYAQWK